MKHTPANTESVVVECDLPDSPEKVWRALTDRELVARWLMPGDIRPEVGARFQLRPTDTQKAGEPAPLQCEVLEAEPGRRLRWRQREPAESAPARVFIDSVVTFDLSGIPGGGTHLRVTHDEFTHCVVTPAPVTALRARVPTDHMPTSRRRVVSARHPVIMLRKAA